MIRITKYPARADTAEFTKSGFCCIFGITCWSVISTAVNSVYFGEISAEWELFGNC